MAEKTFEVFWFVTCEGKRIVDEDIHTTKDLIYDFKKMGYVVGLTDVAVDSHCLPA